MISKERCDAMSVPKGLNGGSCKEIFDCQKEAMMNTWIVDKSIDCNHVRNMIHSI